MTDGYFMSAQETEQVEMLEGLHRRTMGTTDEAMLCEFFLERGTAIPEHSHQNDQVGYVVFGKIKMTINDEVYTCLPGDSFAIPGGIVHSTLALVDSLVINVFSPPVKDYEVEAR
ncbi:MAG: cupin domain-containing protein [Chloroflexi bacterium]|nr:MAG: cupin domain-containing protein [Chloroflexota bacterium]